MKASFALILLVFMTLLMSCKDNITKDQPNILFIFADDWGYGDLGCYGNDEVMTPSLDRLAVQGTRYTQFHVASGVCSPSRTAVITGHFPARHRVHGHFAGNEPNAKRGMPNWLNENLPVYLPRMMQEAGYTTAHFGKWHLGGGGLPHGDLSAPEPKEYGYDETRVWNGNGPTWNGDQHWPTTRYMDSDTLWVQSSSRIVVDETIDFLKRNKGTKPLFVNLWLKDPHNPLWPSDEQRKPYKGIRPDKETLYAVLTDADFHIGRLLQALTDLGLEDNTIVIFSSDNGPAHTKPALTAGSTGGMKGRKVDIFQGGVNVPFIVRWPGKVHAGKVDSVSVLSGVDLLPTFCELAGKQLPDEYQPDGESFASIFRNIPFKRTKPLFWEWRFARESNAPGLINRWPVGAIRKDNWKLYVNNNRDRIELYDLTNDKFEQFNLAEHQPETVEKMLALWENWKFELPK